MKKKNIKKTFNKKTSFALLLGIAASFSPLLVMGSCNVTTSQGDKDKSPGSGNNQNPDQNQDVISKELQKLTYTALSDEDLKNVTISDAVLDEGVSEKLGFILPDVFREYIEKEGEEAAQYTVRVSKTKGSLEINYKYQKTGEKKEKSKKVTMAPYKENDLSTILEELKNYNATFKGKDDWKNIIASDFDTSIDGGGKAKDLQIKKLADYAWNLKNNKNIKAYIRKVKNEDTIKYVVVKTLEQEQKIIVIGDSVKVSSTSEAIIAIRNKLINFDSGNGQNPLIASVTIHGFKNLEYGRTAIIPEDPNNKFDWDAIKTTAPAADQLPGEDMLQAAAAATKGKIEVEKLKGEAALHWYITYIDKNNNPLTEEWVTVIFARRPTLEEAAKYNWENATILKHGDEPSDLIFATKSVITRIEKKDENDMSSYIYSFTNISDYRGDVLLGKYSGILIGTPGLIWVASNAETKYFDNIKVLFSAAHNPPYESFNDEKDSFIPEEVRYMEA